MAKPCALSSATEVAGALDMGTVRLAVGCFGTIGCGWERAGTPDAASPFTRISPPLLTRYPPTPVTAMAIAPNGSHLDSDERLA